MGCSQQEEEGAKGRKLEEWIDWLSRIRGRMKPTRKDRKWLGQNQSMDETR